MPTIQLIPNLKNREFTSGPGDWTGETNWVYGPHEGQYGYLKTEANVIGETHQFKLSYPFVLSEPGETLTLTRLSGTEPLPLHDLLRTVTLTDGVYSLVGTVSLIPGPPGWAHYQHIINTPADWNKLNTSIIVDFINLADHYDILYDDKYSLTYVKEELTRIDYLPLMGVS